MQRSTALLITLCLILPFVSCKKAPPPQDPDDLARVTAVSKSKDSTAAPTQPLTARARLMLTMDVTDFEWEVLQALLDGDYETLESLSRHLRKTHERFDFGKWKLAGMYEAIEQDYLELSHEERSEYYDQTWEWQRVYPKSLSARVMRARLLIATYMATVGRSSNPAYNPADQIKEAHYILSDAARLGLDPGILESSLKLASLQHMEMDKFDDLAQEIISVYPDFPTVYWRVLEYYMQRTDTETLSNVIERYSEFTRADQGDAMYFYMMAVCSRNSQPEWTLWFLDVDWDRLEKGYHDFEEYYGEGEWSRNTMCKIVARSDNKELARSLFDRIGETPDVHVWPVPAYRAWRSWCFDSGPRPEFLPIHYAAEMDDVEGLRAAIEAGGYVNAFGPGGQTPLLMAAWARAWDAVLELCRQGADASITTEPFDGPLTPAARDNRGDVIVALLEHGADPSWTPSKTSWPPLLHAARFGNVEALSALLEFQGTNVNHTMPNGATAVMLAAERGHMEAFTVLYSNARLDKSDLFQGESILHRAAVSGNAELAGLLIPHCDVNGAGSGGETPLCRSVSSGDVEISRMLLDAGAEPNIGNEDGIRPLERAMLAHSVELGRMLLDAGADPNLVAEDGTPPITTAVDSQFFEGVQMLLEAGADPNIGDKADGWTSLHNAAMVGSLPILQMLLEAGGDIEITTDINRTLLQQAAKNGSTDVAAYLIQQGLDINARDDEGYTALMFAEENHFAEVAEILRANGAT